MTTRSRLAALPKGLPRVPPPTDSGFYQRVEVNGVGFPPERIINFIAGNGISIVGADDPGNNRTNITITALFCDHVVRTLADLPGPVAGSINLTSGSWCFVQDLDLGANKLTVPAGVDAFLTAEGKRLTSSNGTATLDVATATSLVDCQGLDFVNTGAGRAVRSLNDGGFYSRFELCTFTAAGAVVFEQGTGGVLIDTCGFLVPGTGILMSDNAARVICTASHFTSALGATAHIEANLGFSLQLTGCLLEVALIGVALVGDPDHCSINGNEFTVMDTGVSVTAAGMQDLRIQSNDFNTMTFGIAMPAPANTPAGGLSLVGNSFSSISGANFSGFTHASAKVNSKANLGAAGLLSETPIVP